jgi:hypothetical protein
MNARLFFQNLMSTNDAPGSAVGNDQKTQRGKRAMQKDWQRILPRTLLSPQDNLPIHGSDYDIINTITS